MEPTTLILKADCKFCGAVRRIELADASLIPAASKAWIEEHRACAKGVDARIDMTTQTDEAAPEKHVFSARLPAKTNELLRRSANEGEQPTENDLPIWVIYGTNTPDYPGKYVLRRQWVARDPVVRIVTDRFALLADDVETLRKHVPPGCVRIDERNDENSVLESWI